MNIMHNKMVKFITQLRRTTQNKQAYQLISQPKLDKFQLQCYCKCSKWRPLISMQQRRHLRHWSAVSSTILCSRPDHSWKRHLLRGNAHLRCQWT